MPLHDWRVDREWENFHTYWIVRIAEFIRPILPEGYRVYVGSYSRAGLAMSVRPDVGVETPAAYRPQTRDEIGDTEPGLAPDEEVTVGVVEPWKSVYVQYSGLMVAAVELISPGNNDRPSTRAESTARYAGYLRGGINLLLVDLLPAPAGFSFADAVAAELAIPNQPPVPSPFAVAYRVGEPVPGKGSFLAVWRRSLAVGQPLPPLPLPLTVHSQVLIDLEATYMRAAADAYLA